MYLEVLDFFAPLLVVLEIAYNPFFLPLIADETPNGSQGVAILNTFVRSTELTLL